MKHMDLALPNRRLLLLALCLACLFVGLVVVAPALSLSLSPPILLWACQPARQASGREARGGQAGRKKRGGRPAALPLSLPLPPPLASCLLVVYSASLLPSPLPPSVVVVLYWRKMRGWPGPLSSSLSSQATNIRPPHWTPLCLSSLSALHF